MDGKVRGRKKSAKAKTQHQTQSNKHDNTRVADKTTDETRDDISPEAQLARYEQELWWCMQQLELGLAKQRPDSKQAAEAVKILKILRNPSAPMVKKRQAMRNTFGDYRKKMAEEEKKQTARMQASKSIETSPTLQKKATFLRKSSAGLATRGQSCEQSTEQMIANLDLNSSDHPRSGFKFNFTVAESTENDMESGKNKDNVDSKPEGYDTASSAVPMETASVNYYHMQSGAQSFTFNFPSPSSNS